MPRNKRYNKKSRKGKSKRPRKGQKKPRMSKGFKKEVTKLVVNSMENKAETKYINPGLNSPTSYTSTSTEVDTINNRALIDITPTIGNGDTYENREGDRILGQYLQTRFRIKPKIYFQTLQHGSTVDPSREFEPPVKYIRCCILKVDKTSAITAGEVDECLRRPLENWMDTRQSASRDHRREFKCLAEFNIPLKYNTYVRLDSSTVPAEWNNAMIPKTSYYESNLKIDQKLLFNNNSVNKPVKFNYMLFMTWGNYFRNGYTDVDFPNIDIWKSITFKDL